MIITDTSAIVPAMTEGAALPTDESLHAPAGVDLEFMSALRRMTNAGLISPSDAREALDRFRSLPLTRHETTPLLPRVWAFRHDITTYDAAFVALAEALGAPLLTRDRRLARTAQRYCDVIAL